MSSELLARAASCYVRAGWTHEAIRCFERMGRHAEAARLYEQLELWPEAARAYVVAGAWSHAARCFLRAGDPASAAEYLLRAGDDLEAGWILAHRLHRFRRARAVVEPAAAQHPSTEAARELVLARCEAGNGEPRPAARRVRKVIAQLGDLGPGPGRQRAEEWAAAVADSLGRPDLVARLYAEADRVEMPGAVERWEAWATGALGDASGIPLKEEADHGEG